MKKVLDYILKKLPDHQAPIRELFEKNEDFRTLCEDYLTTAEGLNECRNKSLQDIEMENEFALTYLELEKEIIFKLGSYNDKQ